MILLFTFQVKKLFKSSIADNEMVVMVVQTHSKSTGTIRLRSTDPFDHPIIKPNYFDDPSDLKTMLAGKYIYLRHRLDTVPVHSQEEFEDTNESSEADVDKEQTIQ